MARRKKRNTTGAQTLTATDTVTSSITGTANINVNAAPVATHFAVQGPEHVFAGSQFNLYVVALDASNHPVYTYTGTVHFTSSDANATLPADYTFVADDHGAHAFHVTLATAGAQTVTATDTTTSSINGTAHITVDPIPTATHFAVQAREHTLAGSPAPLTVVALDGVVVPG